MPYNLFIFQQSLCAFSSGCMHVENLTDFLIRGICMCINCWLWETSPTFDIVPAPFPCWIWGYNKLRNNLSFPNAIVTCHFYEIGSLILPHRFIEENLFTVKFALKCSHPGTCTWGRATWIEAGGEGGNNCCQLSTKCANKGDFTILTLWPQIFPSSGGGDYRRLLLRDKKNSMT